MCRNFHENEPIRLKVAHVTIVLYSRVLTSTRLVSAHWTTPFTTSCGTSSKLMTVPIQSYLL